jgi:hypothetical protein
VPKENPEDAKKGDEFIFSIFRDLGNTIGLVDVHQAMAYLDKLKVLGIKGCIHFDSYFSGMKETLPDHRVERFIDTTRRDRLS